MPESFSHPAKMVAPLLLWIVNRYTEPGQTILDPMAGSGTMMLACPLGRDVVMVELEQKFVRMQVDNWQKVRQMPQLGYKLGDCSMLWGDARNTVAAREHPYQDLWAEHPKLDYATIKAIRRKYRLPLHQGHNLEGLFDSVITSPPYAENTHHGDDPAELEYLRPRRRARVAGTAGNSPDNIGNLKYGEIDAVVSSDKRQTEGDMTVVYITFFEVDNPIALLLKTLVPSSVLSSLSARTMPEIAVSFNDSSMERQEEIYKIPPDLELCNKLYALVFKIFGNRKFQTGESSLPVTFKGTEDTPVTLQAVGLDIEGIPAQSALALNAGSASIIATLKRAILTGASFKASGLSIEGFATLGADIPYPLTQSKMLTGLGAILTPTTSEFTGSALKLSSTDDTLLLNTCPSRHTASIIAHSMPQVECVVTSPPYEAVVDGSGEGPGVTSKSNKTYEKKLAEYGKGDNIGNLKSTSYLEAMLQVYGQCHKVLRDGGLMILVTKDFVRAQKRIDLAGDTIRLCEQAGFSFVERHYRKLTAVSFWRTIYKQKYPDAPEINTEDILVFRK